MIAPSRRAVRLRPAYASVLLATALSLAVSTGFHGSPVVEAGSPTGGPAAAAYPSGGASADDIAGPGSGIQLPSVADSTTGSSTEVPDSVANARGVIVRWANSARSNGASPSAVQALSKAGGIGLRYSRVMAQGYYLYDSPGKLGNDALMLLARLRSTPGVASVEPDLWVTADATPNDPLAPDLWGLLQGSAYGVDATSAWATTQGAGVTVAVIDTGLVAHPDLAGQSIPGYDMIWDSSIANDGDGRDADASDPGDWCGTGKSSWHGTHVAGTIAALANNGTGVFGGAPGVKIEPVRVLGQCGGYLTDTADAIRWAAGGTVAGVPANPHPAKVLSLSLGANSSVCPDYLASAIGDARSRGAVVVVAAGNSGADAGSVSPANCAGVITVGATDSTGQRASFSNYGPDVEISGPGVHIESTIDSGATTPAGPTYAFYDGTSMATPHVTLTAALVAAADPSLGPDAIAAVLESTATPVAAGGGSQGCLALGCGSGIVNAGRAVTRLTSGPPTVGSISASGGFAAPGATLTVSGLAVGGHGVAGADAGFDGAGWTPIAATDGSFGSHTEAVSGPVVAPMTSGQHQLCLRATGSDGQTGDGTTCIAVTVDAGAPTVATPVLSATTANSGAVVAVSAAITDDVSVSSAQVKVDGGDWADMLPSDGAFGGRSESAGVSLGGGVSSVQAGYHSCVLLVDGRVECWGLNDFGELGDGGSEIWRSVPVIVSGLTDVVQVSVGWFFSCALLKDTTVKCWGDNAYGQLGDGSNVIRHIPVSVIGLSGVTKIAAGEYSACALMSDTTIKCWGRGAGADGNDIPVAVPGLTGVLDVIAGGTSDGVSACALLADRTVDCWGDNWPGELGDGTTTTRTTPAPVVGLTNVVALSTGYSGQTCAILADGQARCWGNNLWGQLGDETGEVRLTPVTPNVANVVTITVGAEQTCALLDDATVSCWGDNQEGEVGDGTPPDPTHWYPVWDSVAVVGLTGVRSIASGTWTNCALLADGTVRCWGKDDFGQVGDPTRTNRSTPFTLATLGALSVGSHTICVRAADEAGHVSDGTACTGLNVTTPPAPGVLRADAVPATAGPAAAPAGAPGSPRGVWAETTGTSARIAWLPPASAGSSPVTSYRATAFPGGQHCDWSGGDTACSVTGLAAGTAYIFTVTATNSEGTGLPSARSNAAVAGLAGRPTNVAGNVASGHAVVTWTAPTDSGGSPIHAYHVVSDPGPGSCVWTSGPMTCTLSVDPNYSGTFRFVVSAVNDAGPGTPSDLPGPPASVTVTSSAGSTHVSWDPSSDPGVWNSGMYVATSNPEGLSCRSGAMSCDFPGLSTATGYQFRVREWTIRGLGAAEDSPAPAPAPAPPGKPLAVTASARDRSAAISWTPPASDGGASITGYSVTETEQGLGVVPCPISSGTSCTVSGLTNGTEYTFTVHASNSTGGGPESDPSNPVTPVAPTAPGKPTNVAATPGNASASVTWTAPADDGGAGISAYTVTASDGTHTCGWTTGALTCAVHELTNGQSYTFTVTATNGVGPGPASDPSAPVTPAIPVSTADTYYPVDPIRLVDTRNGTGLTGKLVAGVPRTFQITGLGGLSNIPAGATAVTANVTMVNSTASSSVYLGPSEIANPTSATINFNRNDVTACGSTITLSDTGTMSVTYMASSGTTDLVIDVAGYFAPDTTGDTYHSLTPVRLLDTRIGNGLKKAKLKANVPVTFTIRGRGGVPAAAVAVSGNVTVTDATGGWAVYIGPKPLVKPVASTLNFVKGQTRANSVTVPLSATGTLSATFLASGKSTIDLVFDVTGFYTADATGAKFVPLQTPTYLLDTRTGSGPTGKLVANTPRTIPVAGLADVPANATAITGIVSVYNQSANWAVFLGPDPIAKPAVSNLNFLRTDNCANGFAVALNKTTGSLSVTYMGPAGATTNLVLVVTGYFVPAS